jgi:uncharacterized alkaline shock family protein YloU
MADRAKPAIQGAPQDGVKVSISTDVLREIAQIEITETDGVDVPEERESQGMFRRHGGIDVSVDVSGQDVVYQVRFGVMGGARIPQVASDIRERIVRAVRQKTGHRVRAVHVLVDHVSYEDEGPSGGTD